MLHSHTYLLLSGLVPFISARPFLDAKRAGGFVGVATFNDYANQSGGEVCSNAGITTAADDQSIYKAAAGDISPNLSAGLCDGSSMDPNFQYDLSKCTPEGGVVGGYQHPGCPNVQGSCGKCYRVSNFGDYPTDTGAQIGQTIVVQIVDACPAGSALNYCKIRQNPPVPADERCGAGNSLDIDTSAYKALTGTDYALGKPNLKIHIQSVPCTGGSSTHGGSTQGGGSSHGGSTQGGSTQGGNAHGGSTHGGSTHGGGASQGGSTHGAQHGGSVLTQGGTYPRSGNLSTITSASPNPNLGSSHHAQQQSGNTNHTTGTAGTGYNNPGTQQQATPDTDIGDTETGTGRDNPSKDIPGGVPDLAGLLGSPAGAQQGGGVGELDQLFGLGGVL